MSPKVGTVHSCCVITIVVAEDDPVSKHASAPCVTLSRVSLFPVSSLTTHMKKVLASFMDYVLKSLA